MLTLIIVLILTIIIFFILIVQIYNDLIQKNNQVLNMESSINVILKKRYDLIPNLIASVKIYMNYESDLLEKLVQLRSKSTSVENYSDKFQIENQISQTLRGIMLQFEQYPDLKANQNVLHLQTSINEIEEQLSAARRAFNSSITSLNNAIQSFPSNMWALFLGFKVKDLFTVLEQEKNNINVSDLFNSK